MSTQVEFTDVVESRNHTTFPSVVCITGLAGSGKDTSATYIVEQLKLCGFRAIRVGLADQLKFICQKLIKLFHCVDISIDDFFDQNKKELICPEHPKFNDLPFKLRTILQLVGSEVFREYLWEDIWCDYANRKYIQSGLYDVIVISDSRFPNEITYFEDLKTQGKVTQIISCRIIRPNRKELESTNQLHQSEVQIMTLPVQMEILNDSNYETLYQQLNEKIVSKLVNSDNQNPVKLHQSPDDSGKVRLIPTQTIATVIQIMKKRSLDIDTQNNLNHLLEQIPKCSNYMIQTTFSLLHMPPLVYQAIELSLNHYKSTTRIGEHIRVIGLTDQHTIGLNETQYQLLRTLINQYLPTLETKI